VGKFDEHPWGISASAISSKDDAAELVELTTKQFAAATRSLAKTKTTKTDDVETQSSQAAAAPAAPAAKTAESSAA
jgi:hypothetical protein